MKDKFMSKYHFEEICKKNSLHLWLVKYGQEQHSFLFNIEFPLYEKYFCCETIENTVPILQHVFSLKLNLTRHI